MHSHAHRHPVARLTGGTTALALVLSSAAALADEAMLERFVECYAEETGAALDEAARAALAESTATADSTFAERCGPDCDVAAAPCDAVADAWASALGAPGAAPPEDAPPWAREFADALVDRIGACFHAETGERLDDAQAAALGAYGSSFAGALVSLTEALDCTPGSAELSPCLSSIRSLPCASLAGELAEGASGLAADTDACGAFFACSGGTDDAEIDALFARELGGAE